MAIRLMVREALERVSKLGNKLCACMVSFMNDDILGLVAMAGYGSTVSILFLGENEAEKAFLLSF